jgi:hypothetical protein
MRRAGLEKTIGKGVLLIFAVCLIAAPGMCAEGESGLSEESMALMEVIKKNHDEALQLLEQEQPERDPDITREPAKKLQQLDDEDLGEVTNSNALEKSKNTK